MSEHTTDPGPERDQDSGTPPVDGGPAKPGGSSRRLFLAGAGAGALGAAAAGALVTAVPAAAGTAAPVETDAAAASGQEAVVAYVSDVLQGEITLFRGGDEVVVQDRGLARTLANRFDQALARTTNQES